MTDEADCGNAEGAASAAGSASLMAREEFMRDWAHLNLTASSADYYFNSYNHYGVHEDVIKDGVTMSAYSKALTQNAHLLRGAVVLDVCAGLGLCSLLAVRAGAKRVIALEAQAELVAMGSAIAKKNGFGPEVLTFICGSASSLEDLPDNIEQVDIIVSEWMGYFLMYEARLEDVLMARDRWLKPGGFMFPDHARLYLALLEDPAYSKRHFDYYNKVWGFNFSAMRAAAHSEPVVNAFEHTQLLSSATCVLDLDLYKCTASDCFELAASYDVRCKRDGTLSALLCWFEIRFDACHVPVTFDTGPEAPPTCWKQTAFFLNGDPLLVNSGKRVKGMLAVRKMFKARRSIDVKVMFHITGGKPQIRYFRWT